MTDKNMEAEREAFEAWMSEPCGGETVRNVIWRMTPEQAARSAWGDATKAALSRPAHVEDATCGACNGTGWVPRDPDIGTDQECFVCEGSGKVEWDAHVEDAGGDERKAFEADMAAAGATYLGSGSWEWDIPTERFLLQFRRAALAHQAAGAGQAVASAIHYPDCWDTVAYPTLDSALAEVYEHYRCTNDECAAPPEAQPAGGSHE